MPGGLVRAPEAKHSPREPCDLRSQGKGEARPRREPWCKMTGPDGNSKRRQEQREGTPTG